MFLLSKPPFPLPSRAFTLLIPNETSRKPWLTFAVAGEVANTAEIPRTPKILGLTVDHERNVYSRTLTVSTLRIPFLPEPGNLHLQIPPHCPDQSSSKLGKCREIQLSPSIASVVECQLHLSSYSNACHLVYTTKPVGVPSVQCSDNAVSLSAASSGGLPFTSLCLDVFTRR